MSRLDASLAILDEKLAEDPDDVRSLAERGILRLEVKLDYEGGLADLERLCALKPASKNGRAHRARGRFLTGDWRSAALDLETLAAEKTDRGIAWFTRAELRLALGDTKGAIADLDRTLELHDWPPARLRRSEARAALGDAAGALADLDAVLAASPAHTNALVARAELAVARKDWDAAAKDSAAAAEAATSDPWGPIARARAGGLRARIALARGAPEQATKHLEAARVDFASAAKEAPSPHRRATILLEQARLEAAAATPRAALDVLARALEAAPARIDLLREKAALLAREPQASPEEKASAARALADVEATKLPKPAGAAGTPTPPGGKSP